jgi:hypothetical protein
MNADIYDPALRISEALDHLDRANAIYSFIFTTLSGFKGTGDFRWDHQLAASVNVANFIGGLPESDEETISLASREIVKKWIPRLLCIALVSAIETCFKDITESLLRMQQQHKSDEEIRKEVGKINRGGPSDYLPRLARVLGLPILTEPAWDWFKELVATRNVLIHKAELTADKQYVDTAGPLARVGIGQPLAVDSGYMLGQHAEAKYALLTIISKLDGNEHLLNFGRGKQGI